MRIVHLLSWKLNDVKNNLDLIKHQNFDAVQINPLQPLKEESTEHWWMSYQPISFDIGNVYGSKEDLKNLCQEAQYRDIKIFADVICNHMAGKNDGSLIPHEKVDPELRDDERYWKRPQQILNWNDRRQVIHYCMGLPGLNVCFHKLQNKIIDFLNNYTALGVSGFRFDAAKNIALPREGCDFWPRVISWLDKKDAFLYGEVIFEKEAILKEYKQYIHVLTNEGHVNPHEAIKFHESHDSYQCFKYTSNESSAEVANHYYHLNQQWPNTMFYARPYDDTWKSDKVREANYQKVKR